MELLKDKHVKYYRRNLDALPHQYTPYDSSRTSLVYFCVNGLNLLGNDTIDNESRSQWIEWVYSNLVSTGDGFRGSSTHKSDDKYWDLANIAPTFFCISILAILKDESVDTRLPRERILDYIGKCQRPDGSFASMYSPELGPIGDKDPRYTYMAAAICRMLNGLDKINIDSAVQHVWSTKGYDGGFGDSCGSESHSGLVYCAIAALTVMERLGTDNQSDWLDTARWLSQRQVTTHTDDITEDGSDWYGGFNGRINKPADTCYSFWSGASLSMLGYDSFYDKRLNRRYLLEKTQHRIIGGFGKHEGSIPDPLHSCLGLASLALEDTASFDASLCMRRESSDFILNKFGFTSC